jgi:hypothetical protein
MRETQPLVASLLTGQREHVGVARIVRLREQPGGFVYDEQVIVAVNDGQTRLSIFDF